MGKGKDNVFDMGAYCPFWRGTKNKSTICCEGPYKRTSICTTFATKRDFDMHRQQYCYGKNCENCRVYACVMEQYEEKEKRHD